MFWGVQRGTSVEGAIARTEVAAGLGLRLRLRTETWHLADRRLKLLLLAKQVASSAAAVQSGTILLICADSRWSSGPASLICKSNRI